MKKLILIFILSLLPSLALAQTTRNPCFLNGQTSTNGIPSCESVSNTSPLPVYQGGASFTNITTSTDTVIKTSAGTLQGFTVNTAGTSVVFYNNTACSGAKIGTFTTTAQTSILINAAFSTGLCATTVWWRHYCSLAINGN